jgi:hypothetical protein
MTISWLKEKTIFLAKNGSRAYGMHHSESDVDIQGIMIPPKEYFFGFSHRIEQFDKPMHMEQFIPFLSEEEKFIVAATKIEGTIYGIHKFFALSKDCNPNLIQLLYSDNDSILICNTLGEKLRQNRNLFLSKNARFRFSGYAISQLKRIQLHRGYLLNPKENKPKRSDYGLAEKMEISSNDLAMVRSEIGKQLDRWNDGFIGDIDENIKNRIRESIGQLLAELKISEANKFQLACNKLGFDENFIKYFQKENEYHRALTEWESFQNWKKTRNPERAAMESKFGYDGKHAAHLVRLMRMAVEILRDGEVHVKRSDAKELLEIRNGSWNYEKLVAYAENMDSIAAELYKTSKLPHSPDVKALDNLCMEMVEYSLKG